MKIRKLGSKNFLRKLFLYLVLSFVIFCLTLLFWHFVHPEAYSFEIDSWLEKVKQFFKHTSTFILIAIGMFFLIRGILGNKPSKEH